MAKIRYLCVVNDEGANASAGHGIRLTAAAGMGSRQTGQKTTFLFHYSRHSGSHYVAKHEVPSIGMGQLPMALNVQMTKSTNAMLNESIITPRLVNQQVLSFSEFCDHMANGSTVTAADVAAVMKQLEKSLPTILSLNTKVIISPDGLTIRPTVKGSMTQSQLKTKLTAKRDAYLTAGDSASAAKVDVNREIETSDLTTSDLTASIVIDLPKRWDTNFQQIVTFKRVNRVVSVAAGDGSDVNDDDNDNHNDNQGNGSATGNGGTGQTTGGGDTSDDDDDMVG